jgi:hypothetical protein
LKIRLLQHSTMMPLFAAIDRLEALILKTAGHPEREKLLLEKGLPIYQEIETPPPSENKPIDEEKVADYFEMVALKHRINQLKQWIDEDPFAFASANEELERRKVELETLLEKRSPQ